MRSLMRITVLAGTALLTGCVNKVLVDFPRPVVGETCTVVVYRAHTMNTGAVAIPISLNGREIAAIMLNSRLELILKPGLQVVGAGSLNMPISSETGATYYLCINPSEVPGLTLKTKEEAASRLLETTLLATNK